jgi:uncharacterized membrane protein YfcA
VISGVPLGELILLAGAIVLGGIVTGLLSGVFGIGGGAVIVPVLYEIFRVLGVSEDVRIQLCVGTALAIIAPTSLRSFLAHRAKGNLPIEILRIWALPIVAGVAMGGVIAAFAPGWVFNLVFVVMALFIGAKMLFAREDWRLGSDLPGRAAMRAYGFFIGLYSSLMGVGGGAYATLILTLYGKSIHVAVGISAGVGVLISFAGAISFMLAGLPHQGLMPPFSVGFVSFVGVILMAPISASVAPYGARLAHALPKRKLEIAFGCFMLLVAARFLLALI